MAEANEESTFFVTCTFKDEDGNAVTPSSIVWSLRNGAGNIINGRDSQVISSLASVVVITLTGDDLDRGTGPERYLTIEAVYGADNLPLVDEYKFTIKDMKGK